MITYILILLFSALFGAFSCGLIGGYISEKMATPTGTFADGFNSLPGLVIGALFGGIGGVIIAALLMR